VLGVDLERREIERSAAGDERATGEDGAAPEAAEQLVLDLPTLFLETPGPEDDA
jgi:hypothetical protein